MSIPIRLPIFQIDAFTDRPFAGNPAAVCPLESWLPEKVMQAIAAENNLSETAFFVPAGEGFHIRWFTPIKEVSLCGHATLASAWCIFNELGYKKDEIAFQSGAGPLSVRSDNGLIIMDFPANPPRPCEPPQGLLDAFKSAPVECRRAMDYMLVFADEADIRGARPELELIKKLNLRGVIITAPSEKHDFICRFFAPGAGIDEDPVTGSAFTQLAPYWAEKTGRKKFTSRQVSARGGEVISEVRGDRVLIAGRAVKYMEGVITTGKIKGNGAKSLYPMGG